MDSKTFFDNFETIADAPDGISRLRDLILDLAVRGKLVQQVVSDQPSTLDSCEGSFDIPTSWRWAPLSLVAGDLGQEVPKTKFHYIDVGSINSVIGCISDDAAILESSKAPSRARKKVGLGTVLYSTVRPYLRNIAIIDREFQPKAIASTAFAVLHPNECIESKFLFVCVRSPYFTRFVESKQKGVAYPAINASDLKEALIPLPPFDEQKRIVAKVDELMALCDELETAQNQRDSIRTAARRSAIDSISTATTPDELNAAWKRISDNWLNIADTPESISSLRSLILGLAVRGKLVPQIANEKLLEAVTVNGKFELPNSWNWVKISTVTEFVNGFAFKSEEYCENGIGIVRMSDLKLGQIAVQGMKRVPEKYRTILDENLRVSPGDLVIGMSGSIGKPCFNLTDETFLLNQRVGKFVPHSVDKNYLAIVLQTLENSFLEMSAGSGIKNLSTKQIKDAELPLPPALEQKRIVSKVDELMSLCDQLENSLIKRDELAKKIAGSLASEIAA
jgi:type I restriction enzyme S subunit